MMNFDEFLESVKERIQAVVPDAEVRIQHVNKLQGESYTGISVQPEGANAAATFNINHAYERYQADQSKVSSILDKIAADAKETAGSMPVFNIRDITDYETVKNNLLMQVVPAEANKEMLEGIPHKTVGDIAVVYRIDLQDATTLVTNQLLEEYGISAGQLHADAVTAQIANHPPVLKNMSEIMAEMSGGMFDIPESPMWVASIEGGMNGLQKDLAETSSFFRLPCMRSCLFLMTVHLSEQNSKTWSEE